MIRVNNSISNLKLINGVWQRVRLSNRSAPTAITVLASTPTLPTLPPTPIERVKSIRGFPIPSRPPPPKEEECCMSGCVNCIYDLHLLALQDHSQLISNLRRQLLIIDPPLTDLEWPAELGDRDASPEGEEQERKRMWSTLSGEQRAFLEFEDKLRKRQLQRDKESKETQGRQEELEGRKFVLGDS